MLTDQYSVTQCVCVYVCVSERERDCSAKNRTNPNQFSLYVKMQNMCSRNSAKHRYVIDIFLDYAIKSV